MKVYFRLFLCAFSLQLLSACESGYSIQEFDRWVMHLENKYKREMDRNGYSIHFNARPGNSVLITVTTTPKTKVPRMAMIIEDARQLVIHRAEQDLKVNHIPVTIEERQVAATP